MCCGYSGSPRCSGSTTLTKWNLYFLQIDRWYLERRIYIAVGFNIFVASILMLAVSPWFSLFTLFVGGAMVWFAATGDRIMANALYWLAPSRGLIRKRTQRRCRQADAPIARCHPFASVIRAQRLPEGLRLIRSTENGEDAGFTRSRS